VRDLLLRLIEVQRYDVQIAELSKANRSLPTQLTADEAKLKEARGQVNTLQDELKIAELQRRELESQVKLESTKVKKWEARLAEIRNQREYIALSREIDASKRANKDLEDKVLELMQTAEEKGKLLEALRDDLAVLEVDYGALKAEVERKIAGANARIAELAGQRDVHLKNIPRNVLARYERIRDKRMGLALVAVKEGNCGGCNMQIQPQLFNTLLRVNSLETCPSCSRIIYWGGIVAAPEGQGESGPSTPSPVSDGPTGEPDPAVQAATT
jgi:uncharacterized protein